MSRYSAPTLLAAVITIVPALSGEPMLEDIAAKGMPKDYKAGASTRYAVWQDDDGWHLRYTTSSASSQSFTGTIQPVGGRFSSITPRGTKAKGVAEGPMKTTAPKYTFTSKISGGFESGIDFTLDDKVTAIKFVLKIEGKEMADHIFIGAKNGHPKGATFFLPTKPVK
jgi:hypothetical protein